MEEKPDLVLEKDDYKEALLTLNAVNLSALAHSLSNLATRIWEEAGLRGEGTAWVNTHPIVRMFVSQMSQLTELNDETFSQAYKICKEKGEEL